MIEEPMNVTVDGITMEVKTVGSTYPILNIPLPMKVSPEVKATWESEEQSQNA